MGKPSQFPPGPISQQIEEGREAFARLTRPFMRQVSQPQLLNAMKLVLKDNVFHSTHISGFSKGILRDPGPKGFVALGLFNQALASGEVPSAVKTLWEGKTVMLGPDGKALGPTDLFAVFTGLLDLGLEERKEIPADKEVKVVKELGKWFRRQLALKGVDYAVEDAQRLKDLSPVIEGLIKGKAVHGDAVVEVIPLIAEETGMSEGEVWDVIDTASEDEG